LGSKQSLSNGNEPEELTDLLIGFENANQVQIKLEIWRSDVQGRPALVARAVATNMHVDPVVRARWDSVAAVLPVREYKLLAGLLTGLLYRLDYEIGEAEMRSIGIKRA
jgi:hypothetical protein